jgi:hypothetical protein
MDLVVIISLFLIPTVGFLALVLGIKIGSSVPNAVEVAKIPNLKKVVKRDGGSMVGDFSPKEEETPIIPNFFRKG